MKYDANNRQSFNSPIIILLQYYLFSSVTIQNNGRKWKRLVSLPFPLLFSISICGMDCNFTTPLRSIFDSASLNKPLNRADSHCLNNVNAASFVKLLLYGTDRLQLRVKIADILRKLMCSKIYFKGQKASRHSFSI